VSTRQPTGKSQLTSLEHLPVVRVRKFALLESTYTGAPPEDGNLPSAGKGSSSQPRSSQAGVTARRSASASARQSR